MILSRTIRLKVDGYTIHLSENLKFYKNDKIKLFFIIDELDNTKVDPFKGYLMIKSPDGVNKIESVNIEENMIEFDLDSEYTELVGITKMQIVLIDEYGGKITLPDFNFEIRENIYNMKTDDTLLMSTRNEELLTNNGDNIILSVELD